MDPRGKWDDIIDLFKDWIDSIGMVWHPGDKGWEGESTEFRYKDWEYDPGREDRTEMIEPNWWDPSRAPDGVSSTMHGLTADMLRPPPQPMSKEERDFWNSLPTPKEGQRVFEDGSMGLEDGYVVFEDGSIGLEQPPWELPPASPLPQHDREPAPATHHPRHYQDANNIMFEEEAPWLAERAEHQRQEAQYELDRLQQQYLEWKRQQGIKPDVGFTEF